VSGIASLRTLREGVPPTRWTVNIFVHLLKTDVETLDATQYGSVKCSSWAEKPGFCVDAWSVSLTHNSSVTSALHTVAASAIKYLCKNIYVIANEVKQFQTPAIASQALPYGKPLRVYAPFAADIVYLIFHDYLVFLSLPEI